MVHAERVFVAGIHPSRTWMSGFLSPCDGMHVCTDKTSVYTLVRKSFGGLESEPMLTPNSLCRKKFSLEEDRTHDAASSRTASPTHYQLAIPAPTPPSRVVWLLLSSLYTRDHRPDVWSCEVSAGMGWPGLMILWIGEIADLNTSFCLRMAASQIVWAYLWQHTRVKEINQTSNCLVFDSCQQGARYLLFSPFGASMP